MIAKATRSSSRTTLSQSVESNLITWIACVPLNVSHNVPCVRSHKKTCTCAAESARTAEPIQTAGSCVACTPPSPRSGLTRCAQYRPVGRTSARSLRIACIAAGPRRYLHGRDVSPSLGIELHLPTPSRHFCKPRMSFANALAQRLLSR